MVHDFRSCEIQQLWRRGVGNNGAYGLETDRPSGADLPSREATLRTHCSGQSEVDVYAA